MGVSNAMAQEDIIVNKLLSAYQTKQPIQFLRHEYSLDESSAYSIQDALIDQKCKLDNDKVVGYKISMTSPETQAIAETNEPAYGTLLASNIIKSNEQISLSTLFAPLIEPELMFILTEDLTPEADEIEVLSKSKIAAGIEIPDARYIDWFPNFSLADLICDNTATGLVVLSDPIQPLSFDELNNVNMELFLNGKKLGKGDSSAVLGNPTLAVLWLVKKLSEKGKKLTKGMIISSGTFISPLHAEKGTYTVTFSNVGEVEVTFTA